MRRQKEEAMLQKRQEYVEKTKNALFFNDMPQEKKGKGKKGRSEQYVSDSGGSGGEERREEAPRERKRKRKTSRERKPRGKGKKRRAGGSGDSAAGNVTTKIFQFYKTSINLFVFYLYNYFTFFLNFLNLCSGSESDRPRAKKGRKVGSKKSKKLVMETSKKGRIISKETISTSESESDTERRKISGG